MDACSRMPVKVTTTAPSRIVMSMAGGSGGPSVLPVPGLGAWLTKVPKVLKVLNGPAEPATRASATALLALPSLYCVKPAPGGKLVS